jgi:hypothetical protein
MSNVLTAEQISQLLSQTKSRGEYDGVLRDFLNSGDMGIEVDLQGGPLQGKRAKQVKIGFDNARKKTNDTGLVHPGGKSVRVVAITGKTTGEDGKQVDREDNSEDHVYLINTSLAGGASPDTDSEEAAA